MSLRRIDNSRDTGRNPVKRIYMYMMAGIMCIILMSAACSNDSGANAEPEESATAIKAADAQFTGVLKGIDVSGLSVTVLDLNYNSDMTLYIAPDSEVYNADKALTTIESMEKGMVVAVVYDAATMSVKSIEPDAASWNYDNIENWSLGDESGIFKIADKKYRYDSNLVVVDGDSIIELMGLNEVDTLKAYGVGRKIYSLIVKKGHGFIRPSSYNDFVGGTMSVGYTMNQPVTEDMLVVVPEGSYDVTMRNGNLEGTKPVEVVRNQETLLDMSEFRQKPEDKGKVIFDIAPYGADLYVNGKLTDYSEPIELNYGKHDVKVELIGYETYSGLLNVKSPNPTVVIDLKEENADVEENNNSNNGQNADNNNGNNNNSSNSNNSNNNNSSSNNNNNSGDPGNSNNSNGTGENSSSASVTSAPENKTSIDSASQVSDNTANTNIEYDKDHKITVKEPMGAEVYFNGEYKGIAPCSFPKVIGNETITLSRSGFQTKSYTVVIPNDGQDVTWSFPELGSQTNDSAD